MTTNNNEQVKTKRFTTVKLRDGYDMGEVDRFLDDLERTSHELELKRSALEEANEMLHAELARARDRVRVVEAELAEARAAAAAAAEDAVQPVEPVAPVVQVVPAVEDAARTASFSATRLLEIASREADALVDGAREEAGQVLAEARAEADRVTQAGRAEAERVARASWAEAQAREEELDNLAEEQRVSLGRLRAEALRELEVRRAELDEQVTELVDFESEVRAHLVTYFNQQLETLAQPTLVEQPLDRDATDDDKDEAHQAS